MNDLQQSRRSFLCEAAGKTREASLPEDLPARMERLSDEVDQPCVVAVVGRMKGGKSTFINALLGEDLAKVGVTEATATINRFRYGVADPWRPTEEHRCMGPQVPKYLELHQNLSTAEADLTTSNP